MTKVKRTRRFAEEAPEKVTLNVNVVDEEGNPVDEMALTEDQKEFCAKVARAKYKKFNAGKKAFDAETETIDVTLPEDIESVDIEAVAEDAAAEREAIVDTTAEVEVSDDVEEVAEICKDFAAKIRKASKKFNAEELDQVAEALNEAKEVLDEVVDPDADPNPEDESVTEAYNNFCAALKGKKFSAEELDALEDAIEEAQEAVEAKGEEEVEVDFSAKRKTRTRKFSATNHAGSIVDQMIGKDSLGAFKTAFFNASK